MRALYFAGSSYVLAALVSIISSQERAQINEGPESSEASAARLWFQQIKPSCNPVEITKRLELSPPPQGWEGAGYAAGCQALAGRIGAARATLMGLPVTARGAASAIVFNIGHPVADQGDDVAAGPIMELVLEFWPENYQAVYHAGMSHYGLGRVDLAEPELRRFLGMYHEDDRFTQNARRALDRIAAHLPADGASPGADE